MALNVPNLNKLIAHLEAQPPERINMGWAEVGDHPCGTCGCIIGHAQLLWPDRIRFAFDNELGSVLGFDQLGSVFRLTRPRGWMGEGNGVRRYPAHRVIATLKRLRDRFLETGEIVVDWGPEPGSEPAQPWAAPQAIELTPPALPEAITRLLSAEPVTATEGC